MAMAPAVSSSLWCRFTLASVLSWLLSVELDQRSVTQTSPGAMPTDLWFPTQLRRQGQVCAHFFVQFLQSSGMSMALSYHDRPFEGQTSILHLALSSWELVSLFYHPDCKQERSPFSHVCPPLLTLRLITEQTQGSSHFNSTPVVLSGLGS